MQAVYAAAGPMAPAFYTQPQGVTKYVGDSVILSAFVDGTEPLRYQWKKMGRMFRVLPIST